jgi:hypothetical protein
MDNNKLSTAPPEQTRSVRLDQHDSVRSHVRQQINTEVERLERRIEALRLTQAPHAAIMISAYERMVDRKRGFLRNWDMQDVAAH